MEISEPTLDFQHFIQLLPLNLIKKDVLAQH